MIKLTVNPNVWKQITTDAKEDILKKDCQI